MRISLPNVSCAKDAKAHSFPIQIAYQTQELIQTEIFHAVFADVATSQRVRQPNAINEIEKVLLAEGMPKDSYENGWAYLEEYQDFLKHNFRRNVLITVRSHWDWYIGHLGRFIMKNYINVFDVPLNKKIEKEIKRIGFNEITKQIKLLEQVAEINIPVSNTVKEAVKEMSLVRNLGLHNRWEVDQFYLDTTSTNGWSVRELRLFNIPELEKWQGAMITLINSSWKPIAIKFIECPEYSI